MKKHIVFALIIAFTQLNAQGITFETEWKTAIEKATKENKMIFMDIYTTWCRPCKMWDKKIFTDSAVSDFFNKNFINLKCNAETGWGIKANKHYGFGIFPTFLFIDPVSFEPFYRIENYKQDKQNLIAEGANALRYRNLPPLSMMVKEYENGRRDMAFLQKLIARKSSINLDFTAELIEFMRIFPLEELTKDNYLTYWKVKIPFGSPEYFKIKKRINQNTLASGFNRTIVLVSAQAIVDTAVARNDANLLERMLTELNSLGETNQKTDYLRIQFYYKNENFDRAFSLADNYVVQYLLIEKTEAIKKRDSLTFIETMKPFVLGLRDSVKEKEATNMKELLGKMQNRTL